MQKLAEICVRRPVFATMLTMTLIVLGVFSYNRLVVERFPRVEFPTITVTTRLPGAAPQEVETEITDKIEEAVNTISGIDELRSTSAEGVSLVFVVFDLERNLDEAAQDVRDKINRVLPNLPRTVEQPTIEKLDPDASPIMTISVASNRNVREMTEFADKVLRRQIESVNGVGQVQIIGGRKRQVNVYLDGDKLRGYNLTVTQVWGRCKPKTWKCRAVGSNRPIARLRCARSAVCNLRPTSTTSSSPAATGIRSKSPTLATPKTARRTN